ncbi:MAG TPA: hypothetical protein VIH90_01700 [Candidatus Saccharimonadales bacterium]
MANTPSIKRIQIDKATRTMLIVVSISAFITIFVIIAGHSLLTLLAYQNRVITAKSAALTQLKADINTSKQLITSYQNFNGKDPNILGSSVAGSGPNNGNNAKIVLDALPSVYDYPALTTSLQGLLSNKGVNIGGIGGSDQEASISPSGSSSTTPTTVTATTGTPTATNVGGAVAMPFSISVDGPYQNVQNLLTTFQHSIRPFQFQTISISGNQSDLNFSASAQTFYLPATSFKITSKVVN